MCSQTKTSLCLPGAQLVGRGSPFNPFQKCLWSSAHFLKNVTYFCVKTILVFTQKTYKVVWATTSYCVCSKMYTHQI